MNYHGGGMPATFAAAGGGSSGGSAGGPRLSGHAPVSLIAGANINRSIMGSTQ